MKKPNIIFIQSDQHNASVLGCAGDKQVKTPNIDLLAKDGVLFRNCYCNSPICVASRSSMMAGLLPSEIGVYNNSQSLRSDKATFAHALSIAGYETVLSGRMHFNEPDHFHGFEKRLVGDITTVYPAPDINSYGVLKGASGQNRSAAEKCGAGHSNVLSYDADVLDKTCAFLAEREDDRPLFLTVGFYSPHCPYVCPEDLYNYYYNCLPEIEIETLAQRQKSHPSLAEWFKNRDIEDLSQENIKRIRAAYYGLVTYLDTLVGKLVEKLKESLDIENTIIIYTSDHGDGIGEHGLLWKTNFYEGAARVPFIVSYPKKYECGVQIDGLTSLLDIAPTLIEMGGGDALPKMQGMSLLPILDGTSVVDVDKFIIGQLADIKGDQPSAMIRQGAYKLIAHSGYHDVQLFNLVDDPKEINDLGRNPNYEEVRNKLFKTLSEYWNGEEQIRLLQENLHHSDILKQWAKKTGYVSDAQWKCSEEKNYILK